MIGLQLEWRDAVNLGCQPQELPVRDLQNDIAEVRR